MEEKNYIQDIKDGIFKKLFEKYACIDCGLIPKEDVTELQPGIDIKIKPWIKIKEGYLCPICNRKRKVKKLKEKVIKSI